MTIETKAELLMCGDCCQWLVNADPSGLDYYLNEEESAARLEDIKAGERAILEEHGEGAHIVPNIGEEDGESFSATACDCCGSRLAGGRYAFSVLKDNGLSAWFVLYKGSAPGWQSLPVYEEPLKWQKKGISYTASGYGRKIPTPYVVTYKGRRRRVYACQFSNVATLYIIEKGDCHVIEIERS